MHLSLQIASMLNPHHRQKAVQVLKDGHVVAVQVMTVYGLFADAANPSAVQALLDAKGKPERTAFACLLPPEALPGLVDCERLSAPFRKILMYPERFARYQRIPHFLQIPVKGGTGLPGALVTRGGDGTGDTILSMWLSGYRPLRAFLELAVSQGVVLACTSLNYRHLDSATLISDALAFCHERPAVRCLLHDPYAAAHIVPMWSGSYSILSALPNDGPNIGLALLRQGNVLPDTLEHMYRLPIAPPHRTLHACRGLQLSRGEVEAILTARRGGLPLAAFAKR